MAEIKLEVSIYPTVYTVVIQDSGLQVGEVVHSIWATKHLAEAQAFRLNQQDSKVKWEVATADVGNEIA